MPWYRPNGQVGGFHSYEDYWQYNYGWMFSTGFIALLVVIFGGGYLIHEVDWNSVSDVIIFCLRVLTAGSATIALIYAGIFGSLRAFQENDGFLEWAGYGLRMFALLGVLGAAAGSFFIGSDSGFMLFLVLCSTLISVLWVVGGSIYAAIIGSKKHLLFPVFGTLFLLLMILINVKSAENVAVILYGVPAFLGAWLHVAVARLRA